MNAKIINHYDYTNIRDDMLNYKNIPPFTEIILFSKI